VLALVGAVSLGVFGPARLDALTISDAGSIYGYPYPNAPDCNEQTGANCPADQWGFTQGQCHSWAAYRLNELNATELGGSTFNDTYKQPGGQHWGATANWAVAAAAAGIPMDDTPGLGSFAWWSANGGHVGYVEQLNGDGTVQISEMNADFHNSFDFATLQRGVRWPSAFIHVADRAVVNSAPNPPINAHATAGNGQATVAWNLPASNGSPITSSRVTASPGGTSVTVAGSGVSGTVTGLTNGTSYTFTVHATNANGDGAESAASNAVVPSSPPDAPTNAHATAGNKQATVTWTTPANNGSAITGSRVTAAPGGSSVTVAAGVASGTVTGLTNGTSYTFTVHATNSGGNGPESSPSNAVVPTGPPDAPTNAHATAGNQQATVTWSTPANNGSAITGSRVTAAPGGSSVTVAAGATSGTITGLANGTVYTFSVHATNGNGDGAESAPSNAVVPSTAPDAPTNVHAAAGNHQATVTWNTPANNGSAITSFQLTASAGGGSLIVGTNSGTITGLQNGVAYSFTVHATNSNGDSAESAASNAVVPASVPDAPTNVQAAAGNQRATITWSAVSGNGSPVTGYRVTASPGGASLAVGAGATSAVLTGLRNGTYYAFTVHAGNGNGNGPESGWSNAVIPAAAPGAPAHVDANAGDHAATITWTAADDNGAPIARYFVREYRDGQLVDTLVTARVTHVTVAGLQPGATYTFTVAARNRIGIGPAARSAPLSLVGASDVRPSGYWMLGAGGHVYPFARVANLGNGPKHSVAFAARADGTGYWITDQVGHVRAFGTARSHGGHPTLRPGEHISAISKTLSGNGYWLFSDQGRAFAYGDAQFFGDLAARSLNSPIVASVATPNGRGYYMLGSDGGVFAFGNALFRGSMGSRHLNARVVGIVPTRTGRGYWLVGSDGGIFGFGDAKFRGSMGNTRLNRSIIGMVRYGNGYLMVASDGGVFNFSNKPFAGSLAQHPPSSPIVAIASAG
jgi:surface antigen